MKNKISYNVKIWPRKTSKRSLSRLLRSVHLKIVDQSGSNLDLILKDFQEFGNKGVATFNYDSDKINILYSLDDFQRFGSYFNHENYSNRDIFYFDRKCSKDYSSEWVIDLIKVR